MPHVRTERCMQGSRQKLESSCQAAADSVPYTSAAMLTVKTETDLRAWMLHQVIGRISDSAKRETHARPQAQTGEELPAWAKRMQQQLQEETQARIRLEKRLEVQQVPVASLLLPCMLWNALKCPA